MNWWLLANAAIHWKCESDFLYHSNDQYKFCTYIELQLVSYIVFLGLLQHALQQQSSSYVNVNMTKSVLVQGSPKVGKTSFKSLLFNWKLVLKHHSTAISTVPVHAMITSRMAEKADGKWLDIDKNPEQQLHMLADAIKFLAKNDDKKKVLSLIPSAEDKTSAMQAAKVTEEQPLVLSAPVPVLYPSEVQDVVDLLPQVEGVGELFDTNWIYMLDTGGQPQFVDVSRAFVKLTEKLLDRPDFCYSENGEPLATPSELCMTNFQLIKHFVHVCSLMSSKHEIDVAEDEGIVPPFVSIIDPLNSSKDTKHLSKGIDTVLMYNVYCMVTAFGELVFHKQFAPPFEDKFNSKLVKQ